MTRERKSPRLNRATVEEQVASLEADYVRAHPQSAAHLKTAALRMPGGNTRTVLHFDPFPLVFAEGTGARLRCVDGLTYRDFLGEHSAGLYGHSHPAITAAIREALAKGIVLGGANVYESRLAELISARFPAVEQIRFCNSGTEANLMALCLATAVTGKDAVLFFNGAYHGGGMSHPVRGPKLNLPFNAILSRYNDIAAVSETIRTRAHELAAVIVEPMMGAAGCIPATFDFLRSLRRSTSEHGVLLIFDEVMTSRTSIGGLQKVAGIAPDLTTFGKYLGGGLSFGAFGGKSEFMRRFDPRAADALPHSGTFNNNVLSMAAGLAGLSQVLTEAAIDGLNERAARFRAMTEAVAAKHGVPLAMTGAGSLQSMHFQSMAPVCPEEVATPADIRKLVHLALIERGIYMARRGYIALSLAMDEDDIESFTAALDDVLDVYRPAFG